jgi:hypothetical protein
MPPILDGIIFKIEYKYKKYHSGIICEGVDKGLIGIKLFECDKFNKINNAIDIKINKRKIRDETSFKIKCWNVIDNCDAGDDKIDTGKGD